jgi:peptide/nickel transport system substrate-binding protein
MKALLLALLLLCSVHPSQAETTLRIGVPSLPAALGHPYKTNVAPGTYTLSAIYDALTITDARDGSVKPWLATSWEQTSPTIWRFTLRDDVVFSNGEKFTAEAVVSSLEYLKSDAAKTDIVAGEFGHVVSARAIDARTVEFTLAHPDITFPRAVALLVVVEPKAWAAGVDSFLKKPAGTGPYLLETAEANRWVLMANPRAWVKPPAGRVEILALPDATARVQALQSGVVDAITVMEPADIATVESVGGRKLVVPVAGVYNIAFLLTRAGASPLKDVRVRQAINLAVDKQAITQVLLQGITEPAGQPAPVGTLGHDPSIRPYPYDPARAKSLLAEAGYAGGFAFTLETAVGNGMADAAVFQQIAIDLAKIGVAMNITPITGQQFLRNYQSGQWKGDAFVLNYHAEPTLDGLRVMRFHSCIHTTPWICDRDIQPMIDAAFRETDASAREAKTRAIMRHYHETAPSLFLYGVVRLMGVGPRIESFDASSFRLRWDRMAVRTP